MSGGTGHQVKGIGAVGEMLQDRYYREGEIAFWAPQEKTAAEKRLILARCCIDRVGVLVCCSYLCYAFI